MSKVGTYLVSSHLILGLEERINQPTRLALVLRESWPNDWAAGNNTKAMYKIGMTGISDTQSAAYWLWVV